MKKVKAFLRAVTPTRNFIIGVGGILLLLVVITVLVVGLVLGILYGLEYMIGEKAASWLLTAIVICFWGWMAFSPILDIIVSRYKEYLNEAG
jgi:hypothetical protein